MEKEIAKIIVNYELIINYRSDELDSIIKQIEKTKINPKEFIENNERGLNETYDLCWFALIDILIKKGYAQEFDWKSDFSDILWGVEELFEKQKINFEFDIEDNDLEAGETLTLLNQIIEKDIKKILINLDIDSDSYVTALVSKEAFSTLEKLDNRITKY